MRKLIFYQFEKKTRVPPLILLKKCEKKRYHRVKLIFCVVTKKRDVLV